MPRGHSLSIYTGFLGKMRTSTTMFIGKKAIIITSKKGTTIFFSHYNLFLGKLKEKLVRKARINTDATTSHDMDRIVLMPPGHSLTLLKSK